MAPKAEKKDKTKKYQSFSELFGDGEFYPDLPKIAFKELLDKPLVLHEIKVLRDFNSKFGRHDCGLMLLSTPENEAEKFTTICSGMVVLDRLGKAAESLPLLCTPVWVTGGDSDGYYNLL